jgi:hypothetical protein
VDIDAQSMVGKGAVKSIPATGKAEVISESELVITTNLEKSYAEQLAFLEEPVEVMVAEPQDEKESSLVQLFVQGRSQMIIPGQPIVIKRKYLEVLARAKQIRYKPVVKINDLTGAPVNMMIPRLVLRYNFSVIQDKNPKGAEWLRRILAS